MFNRLIKKLIFFRPDITYFVENESVIIERKKINNPKTQGVLFRKNN